MSHKIRALGSTTDLDRDWKRIRIQCDDPGCVAGKIEGSPAASIDDVVRLLIDAHEIERGELTNDH